MMFWIILEALFLLFQVAVLRSSIWLLYGMARNIFRVYALFFFQGGTSD
jgi:hypothetical protein